MKLTTTAGLALALTTCASLLLGSSSALAQTYPNKPITMIVPGLPVDRLIATCARWPISPANILARASWCRTSLAAAAPGPRQHGAGGEADGYTIAQYPMGMLRIPHMQKTMWHPLNDFSFIIGVSGYTFGFVVKGDSPYKSFNEYIEAARKSAGQDRLRLHRHRHFAAFAAGRAGSRRRRAAQSCAVQRATLT